TFVFVTHDQNEALALSDRIAVFNEGRIEQVGTAEELYERPASLFVAEFIGESNVFHGTLNDDGALVADEVTVQTNAGAREVGTAAAVVVRPERLSVRPLDVSGEDGLNHISGTVAAAAYLGSHRRVSVLLD